MNTGKASLPSSTSPKNTKTNSLRVEQLTSSPDTFEVMAANSCEDDGAIVHQGHDRWVESRSGTCAHACHAQVIQRSGRGIDETQTSFNIYEESTVDGGNTVSTPAKVRAGKLEALSSTDLDTVARVSALVRDALKAKRITMTALKAIDGNNLNLNPFNSQTHPLTPLAWAHVKCALKGTIVNAGAQLLSLEVATMTILNLRTLSEVENCQKDPGLVDQIEAARDYLKACAVGFSVGDHVKYRGAVRVITDKRQNGMLILDHRIETTGACLAMVATADSIARREEITVKNRPLIMDDDTRDSIELATDVFRRDYYELADMVQREKARPTSTKPTSRGILARIVLRYQSRITPSIDQQRDSLSMVLIIALGFGIVTAKEHDMLQQYTLSTERPGDALDALRTALLSGSDLLQLVSASA